MHLEDLRYFFEHLRRDPDAAHVFEKGECRMALLACFELLRERLRFIQAFGGVVEDAPMYWRQNWDIKQYASTNKSEELIALLRLLERLLRIEGEVPDWMGQYARGRRGDAGEGGGWPNTATLILAGERDSKGLLDDLKRWLRGAQKVIICDPYLLHAPETKLFKTSTEYVNFIVSLLPPTARYVKMFGLGFTKTIKNGLHRSAKEGRDVKFFDTRYIHDRYIIRDNSEGRMIGTSFGGFGNKIFTMLPLPSEDVRKLVGLLYVIEQGGNPLDAKGT